MIGLVISIALLWWSLRDVRPAELAEHFGQARAGPLILMTAFATLTFVVRTLRWRYILRLEGEPLPYGPLWHATAIGFMANNLLPARTGEIARALAANRITSVRFSTAAASIGVSRIMDGLTVAALLAVGASSGGFSTQTTIGPFTLGGLITGTTALFAALLVLGVTAVHWPAPARAATRAVTGALLPKKWADKAVAVLDGLLDGLEVTGV